MKKSLKLVIYALILGLLPSAYAEIVNENREQYDIVFTFIRKSQLLMPLYNGSNRIEELENDEPKSISQLEFRKLYLALDKLLEKNYYIEAQQISLENLDLEKVLSEYENPENSKLYPALSEYIKTQVTKGIDLGEILQAVFSSAEKKIWTTEKRELMSLIYDEEIVQYNLFVEANREILEKLSDFANNGFHIPIPKSCTVIRSIEFCIDETEIRSLSEIMAYINGEPAKYKYVPEMAVNITFL